MKRKTTSSRTAMVLVLTLLLSVGALSAQQSVDLVAGGEHRSVAQNTTAANTVRVAKTDRRLMAYYGTVARVSYATQPATRLINLPRVFSKKILGSGVVAVIDTGVDTNHPALKSVIVPGFDFTRDQGGAATDMADISPKIAHILDQSSAFILDQSSAFILDQSSAFILDQSSAFILDQSSAFILDQSSAFILDQSSAFILDQSSAFILDQSKVVVLDQAQAYILDRPSDPGRKTYVLPAAFGHGTMVAGLIHLVAPQAKIMPLKVFKADGSADPNDIVRAIYYAVENGAKVINMSFHLPQSSPEIRNAIDYATQRGVICVSSVGNGGRNAVIFPASLDNVIGVASTSSADRLAPFSNRGAESVWVSAPGEDLITTFPGGRYARVTGTSFSTPLVAGAAALLVGVDGNIAPKSAAMFLTQAKPISPKGGYGRIDVSRAVESSMNSLRKN